MKIIRLYWGWEEVHIPFGTKHHRSFPELNCTVVVPKLHRCNMKLVRQDNDSLPVSCCITVVCTGSYRSFLFNIDLHSLIMSKSNPHLFMKASHLLRDWDTIHYIKAYMANTETLVSNFLNTEVPGIFLSAKI